MSAFDDHFRSSALSRHRHERRGGGALSTRLIRLESPAHAVVDPATTDLVLGLIMAGTAGARWAWDGARPNVASSRRKGTLGLTPIGAVGTFEVDGPSTILIVSLPHAALSKRLAPDVIVPRDFGRLHDAYQDHAPARILCQRLWRAAGASGFGRDGLIDSLSESLLVALAGGDRRGVRETPGLTPHDQARIVARTRRPAADVAALAEAAAMPVRTFRRRFQATYGCPPHRWLASQRLRQAEQLLRDGRLSLSEVALDLGFSSQAHFTAAFRQSRGMSPGRWRREVRA